MSTFKPMKEDGMFQVRDVFFYYAKIKSPAVKYKKKATEKFFENKEYAVDVLVDEDTADEIEAQFGKVAIRKVLAKDFEEAFGVAAPFEAKKYFILKLVSHASYADGTQNTRFLPKLKLVDGKKATNVATVPVGNHADSKFNGHVPDLEIGNGSKGIIVLGTYTYNFEGADTTKPIAHTLYITDLVEYKGADDYDADDELGFESDDDEVMGGGSSNHSSSDKQMPDEDGDDNDWETE